MTVAKGMEHRVSAPFALSKMSKSGGLSTGLSVSRTIVESLGGKIWAANNSDTGATLTFGLPLATGLAAAAQDVVRHPKPDPRPTSSPSRTGSRAHATVGDARCLRM